MERAVFLLLPLLMLVVEGGAKAVADARVRAKATLENFMMKRRGDTTMIPTDDDEYDNCLRRIVREEE